MLNIPMLPALAKDVVEKVTNDYTIGNGYDWNEASLVTFSGLAIVFGMLVLLVVVIMVFGGIMDRINGVKKEKPVKAPKATPAPVATAPVVAAAEDSDEIIAVIAAAVDAMYEGSGVKPVIRRIKPTATKGVRSPWAAAGVFENTRAF